jgi:hypothetical protein
MSNRWKAALAWIASMSVVWTLFVPRAVLLVELLSLSAVGLVVLVVSALWARDQPVRSIRQILQEAEDGPRAAPVAVRLSRGR